MSLKCVSCALDSAAALAERHLKNEQEQYRFLSEILSLLSREVSPERTPPELFALVYRSIRKVLGEDPYADVKSYFNQEMLKLEDELRDFVEKADDGFLAALKVAASGNIIDFGVFHRLKREEVLETVDRTLKQDIAEETAERLKRALSRAETLLYLGDNAGEIVFDKVFIRKIRELYPHLRVTFAVRGYPVINDATAADAREVEMDRLAEIISNGSDVPGTVLSECSESFREAFFGADVVIAKGQGNAESLEGVKDVPLYFIFVCKCDTFSAKFRLKKFDIAVLHNGI